MFFKNIIFILCFLTLYSCGDDHKNLDQLETRQSGNQSGEESVVDNGDNTNTDNNSDTDEDQEVFNQESSKNVEIDGNQIRFRPYRYREIYPEYERGQSSINVERDTILSLTEDDIKAFVKVDEKDFDRVEGAKLQPSEQPWIQLSFVSNITDDVVRICMQVQPSPHKIEKFGETEIRLNNKRVYTIIDKEINCVGAKPDGDKVLDGIVEYYLNVKKDTLITAQVFNDLKYNNKGDKGRIGLLTEFNFIFSTPE